ncbi:LysR family transcriptional regulator [Cuneatibacter sp. NSJ-177]|uniref:LysR family transcriptional regulator n=1 Tax=Cuneatibacter sp. NSJ-177 TaxID=2931401 RepID=UPI001FD3F25C|nr:LysR family transcriptional regulator [Cuneatibacter sp. NSJ-177]MCJ7836200.1 LysR family transcriptional regulator [Cuneatibacter sp. NSJ-177]
MLKDHEYIYAVYTERSFSRAAQKLFISQPALSNKVKRVEEAIGTPIFNRSVTPLQLTTAGRFYIEAVEAMMSIEEQLKETLSQLASRQSGSLTIGASTFFCSYVLPELAADFGQHFPGYTVNILEGNTEDLSQCLQSGVIDLALNVDEMDSRLFDGDVLGTEELILAVPKQLEINDTLTSYRMSFEQLCSGLESDKIPRVSLVPFADEDFLMLKKGNDGYQRAMKMCKNAGYKPRVSMFLDQMLTSYHVAENGHGIAFIRTGILGHVKPTERLFFYRIDDPMVSRTIYLFHRKKHSSAILQHFLDFMRDKKS